MRNIFGSQDVVIYTADDRNVHCVDEVRFRMHGYFPSLVLLTIFFCYY
jgi:hypothetical protein